MTQTIAEEPAPRRRGSVWLKVGISCGITVIVVAIVAVTAGRSAGLFRWVNEFDPTDKSLHGRTMWVAGKLVPKSHFSRRPRGKREQHVFTIAHKGKSMVVHYAGPLPEGMAPGREIIVRGKLAPGGRFTADRVTTKCPSKYKSEYQAGR